MKILYLSFYFEPDLCAGSFRNTPIVHELSKRPELINGRIDVITTLPNRYETYKVKAKEFEQDNNINIHRINIPIHKSGFIDQAFSFYKFFINVIKVSRNESYDLVVASSSRLFTAFLGAIIARQKKIPLFLDIRDLFRETITEIIPNRIIVSILNIILKKVENYTFGYAKHINLVSEGFKEYFNKYKKAKYTFYTNGIDDIFLDKAQKKETPNIKFSILYAGNIGEGQGLHAILPQVASILSDKYEFTIIGDGGAKAKLLKEIKNNNINNIKILDPLSRSELILAYNSADFLFVHLNNLKAFDKVLPSKIFEYAAFTKPIIAGLSGYSYNFMQQNVQNLILFKSCDGTELIKALEKYEYKEYFRKEFVQNFRRSNINKNIANDIIQTVN